jgi:Protein of unknown function (DUF3237)
MPGYPPPGGSERDAPSELQVVSNQGGSALPAGTVPPNQSLIVPVRAMPSEPGQVVVVCTRAHGARPQQQYVPPTPGAIPGQLYRAVLPALPAGRSLDYRIELRRGDRCLATLPPDGSWLTLTGDGAGRADSPAGDEPGHPRGRIGPYWDLDLTYFGTCTVDLRPEIIGYTPAGFLINFFARTGRLCGPLIDAEEVEGAEYVCVRTDGLAVHTKVTTWRNADSAIILEEANGITDLGPDGYTRIGEGSWTGLPPVTAAATWSSAHPDWQWLNRIQTIAVGHTDAETLRVHLDMYLPAAGGRRGRD